MGIRTPPGLTQEQETLLGLGLDAEVHSGHDVRALTGSSATVSISATGEAGDSVTIARGAACPRWVSMDMTDKTRWIKTVPVGTKRLKPCLHGTWNGTPGCDVWTGSVGPYSRLESAAVGGLEGAADGKDASQGKADTDRNTGSNDGCMGEPRTAPLIYLEAAAGGLSERQPTNLTLEPRTVGDSRDSWRSRWTPTLTSGLGRDYERWLPCPGNKNRFKQKNEQNNNKAPLTV